jgi:hypothetical protein
MWTLLDVTFVFNYSCSNCVDPAYSQDWKRYSESLKHSNQATTGKRATLNTKTSSSCGKITAERLQHNFKLSYYRATIVHNPINLDFRMIL